MPIFLSVFYSVRRCAAFSIAPSKIVSLGARKRSLPILRSVATSRDEVALPSSLRQEELPTRYEFKAFEESLYEWWEKSGYFEPRSQKREGDDDEPAYTIPMPPPNVTGRLHLGHAIFVALQDILARFHRMRGRPTLWLPGTDHAGIATQVLVERAVEAEGTSRLALGREAFLERVWRWKEEHGGMITSQMRRLGASADWSRERFTLEPAMNNAVNEAFARLHESGLVYRGSRIVNWSPSLGTAVSDLEVDSVERIGKLYYFKYAIEGGDDSLPVATTRPETILGDAAICVNPDDERYRHLVGKRAVVPRVGRLIPIIADDYVDPEFGTGVLKVTPGHDPNDYAIGKRHDLPIYNVMNADATIVDEYADYAGLDRFECRDKLWADLEASGQAIKVEERPQTVPISQRGGEVIEPLVSTQWFVNTTTMAAKAAQAASDGQIRFVPSRFEKEWFYWLNNIEDWCVSRQLWWGHRIPAWYSSDGQVFVARNHEEARRRATEAGVDADDTLVQDDDVLDTWFSSGLWPMATVGWPNEDSPDFAKYYPATCLETGYDIIFFWVARMVMLGMEFTGKPPFDTIYIHGLIRDAKGEKMSKTKGNVVDPLEIVENYGADVLRYTLVTGITPGQDVPLSMERVEQNRNFANKLWNVGRFVKYKLASLDPIKEPWRPLTEQELSALPLPERWIVSKAHAVSESVAAELEDYAIGEAGRQVYEFLWDELADWFVELSKTRNAGAPAAETGRILLYVFDITMRLIHPFMPHVTEYLWQRVARRPAHAEEPALIVSAWPASRIGPRLPVDQSALETFDLWRGLVRALRNIRAEYNADPKSRMAVTVLCVGKPDLAAAIRQEAAGLALLAKVDVDRLDVQEAPSYLESINLDDVARIIVADGLEAFVSYSDLQAGKNFAKEIDRLNRQLAKIDKEITGLEARINNPGFSDKAPADVVASTKAALAEKGEQRQALLSSIADIERQESS